MVEYSDREVCREQIRDELFQWYCRTAGKAERRPEAFPAGLHKRAWELLDAKEGKLPNDDKSEKAFREILLEIDGKPKDKAWPNQKKVAGKLRISKMEVHRLIKRGELSTNGEIGHKCRVDPASILEYCDKHGVVYNDDDSD